MNWLTKCSSHLGVIDGNILSCQDGQEETSVGLRSPVDLVGWFAHCHKSWSRVSTEEGYKIRWVKMEMIKVEGEEIRDKGIVLKRVIELDGWRWRWKVDRWRIRVCSWWSDVEKRRWWYIYKKGFSSVGRLWSQSSRWVEELKVRKVTTSESRQAEIEGADNRMTLFRSDIVTKDG